MQAAAAAVEAATETAAQTAAAAGMVGGLDKSAAAGTAAFKHHRMKAVDDALVKAGAITPRQNGRRSTVSQAGMYGCGGMRI